MSESSEVAVDLATALHARPAGMLARAAARYDAEILLDHEGTTVRPTGVLAVMGLGATAGSRLVIRASGPDAAQATEALARILSESE